MSLSNKIINHLNQVANSYDEAVEFGKKGINLYESLPEYIINDPDFHLYKELISGALPLGSECTEIREYLSPNKNDKFIDFGCNLNLMFKGYDKWPSKYYGIDISPKTIKLLSEYVNKNSIPFGALHCGSVHDTPFTDNFFDIASCIGVLEYFEKDFVKASTEEFHRILKAGGKIVLDIPDIKSPACKVMMKIEEYLGRPDRFNITSQEFEIIIQKHFHIDKIRKYEGGAMIQYFLIAT